MCYDRRLFSWRGETTWVTWGEGNESQVRWREGKGPARAGAESKKKKWYRGWNIFEKLISVGDRPLVSLRTGARKIENPWFSLLAGARTYGAFACVYCWYTSILCTWRGRKYVWQTKISLYSPTTRNFSKTKSMYKRNKIKIRHPYALAFLTEMPKRKQSKQN